MVRHDIPPVAIGLGGASTGGAKIESIACCLAYAIIAKLGIIRAQQHEERSMRKVLASKALLVHDDKGLPTMEPSRVDVRVLI
eukprot:scaffold72_cov274-Chaetoceros_neogracile.AAC.16